LHKRIAGLPAKSAWKLSIPPTGVRLESHLPALDLKYEEAERGEHNEVSLAFAEKQVLTAIVPLGPKPREAVVDETVVGQSIDQRLGNVPLGLV
jgi:hypothetical protein